MTKKKEGAINFKSLAISSFIGTEILKLVKRAFSALIIGEAKELKKKKEEGKLLLSVLMAFLDASSVSLVKPQVAGVICSKKKKIIKNHVQKKKNLRDRIEHKLNKNRKNNFYFTNANTFCLHNLIRVSKNFFLFKIMF